VESRAAEHDRHPAADRTVLGNELSESARTTRTFSGSTSSTSPTTVPTMVSWPCPADVVCMVAVIEPTRSTLMRQESIQVVVPTWDEQRLERRVAAGRLQARGDADAGEQAFAAQTIALGDQFVEPACASTLSTTV